MAENLNGNFGRLAYFDPNTSIFKNQMGTNSDSITFPYEDYNMAIELIIREYNRYSCGLSKSTNEYKEYKYSTSNGTISFLEGSKLKNDSDDGYLTTKYTDVSMTNPGKNTQECLGIESIDISYQSWFHPQITIKFIDVKGATVMMPAENDYYNNYGNSQIYKAFFSFPYPLFILKVKGFYGKGVTYKLAISKTKIDFDANTGNFIITADFIGHMYGIFADIPMSFLAIAPYTEIGKKYWKEKVEDGTFCFRGTGGIVQAPMMTFPRLKELISTVSQSFESTKFESDSKDNLDDIRSEIMTLTDLIEKYEIVFPKQLTFELESDEYRVFRVAPSDEDAFRNDVIEFYDALKIYKDSYHLKEEYTYYEYFDGLAVIVDYNQFSEKISLNFVKDFSGGDNIYCLSEIKYFDKDLALYNAYNAYDTLSGSGYVDYTYHYKDFNYKQYVEDHPEFKTEIQERIKNLTSLQVYEIIKERGPRYSEIYLDMIQRKEELKEKLEREEAAYKGFKSQFFEQALGFTPSIKNIYELAFAHFDTFLEVFYKNMAVIKDELEKKKLNRQKIHYPDVKDDYTDTEKRINKAGGENTSSRADYLPPFVAYYKDNKDPSVKDVNGNTQKMVLRWPGEMVNSNDLIEVKYIQDLLKASRMYFDDIEAVDLTLSGMPETRFSFQSPSVNTNYFIPMTEYEKANNGKIENPYSALKNAFENDSPDVLGRLFFIFALRIFYILNCRTVSDNNKDNRLKYSYNSGRIEAINFFKAVGEITSTSFFAFLKKYARSVKFRLSDSTEYGKEFIDYITTTSIISGITDVWIDKNSINSGKNLFSTFYREGIAGDALLYEYHSPIAIEKGFKYIPIANYDPSVVKKDLARGDSLLHNRNYIPTNKLEEYVGDSESFEVGKPLDGGSFFIIEDGSYLHNLNENFKKSISKAQEELTAREAKIKNYGSRNTFDFNFSGDYIEKISFADFEMNMTFYNKNGDFYNVANVREIMYKRHDIFDEYKYIKRIYNDFSVFVEPIYKIQKNRVARACLFLCSLNVRPQGCHMGYDGNKFEFKETDVSLKFLLLMEGAFIWFEKNKNDNKAFAFEGDVIETYTTHYKYKKPEDGQWFKITGAKLNDSYFGAVESTGCRRYLDFAINGSNSRKIYLEQYFLNWAVHEFKIIELYLTDASYYQKDLHDDFITKSDYEYILKDKDYNCYAPSNNDLQEVLRDLFLTTCTCFDYYRGKRDYLYCGVDGMLWAFAGFMEQLYMIYGDMADALRNNSNSALEQIYAGEIEDPFRNDDLRLSTYMTMKNLYDKWLCGLPNGEKTYRYTPNLYNISNEGNELNNFIYCDNYFHDIGDKLCLNMTKISEWLNQVIPSADLIGSENNMQIKSASLYDFLTATAEMAGGYLLAIPQKMMYSGLDSMKKAFTPIPSCGDWDEDTSTYMFLYCYKPSEHLGMKENKTIDMNGWSTEGDGFDLTDDDIVGKLFNDDGSIVPAFGVTFAKQNQAYFKNINLTSSTPAVTEVGIANTMNIASKAGEEVRKTTLFGQDIYKIYSNYSYECTVEMMGCMQIFPPMYFQLNNIPMWKGAYLIQKVKHSIKPGDITTTFTGVRQNKYAIPLGDDNIIGFVGKTGSESNETLRKEKLINDVLMRELSTSATSQINDTIGNRDMVLEIANENDFTPNKISTTLPLICLTPAHGPKTDKKDEWKWSNKLIKEYILPMLQSKKIKLKDGREETLNIHICNIDGKNTYDNGYSMKETEELIKKYGSKNVISIVPHWNGCRGDYYAVFYGKVIGDRKNLKSGWKNPRNSRYRSDSVELAKYIEAEVEKFLNKKDLFTKAPDGMFKKFNKDLHLLFTDNYSYDRTDPAVKVNCACILTENWFADYGIKWNDKDYNVMADNRYVNGRAWLESDEGLNAIAEIHVNAIVEYIKSLQ